MNVLERKAVNKSVDTKVKNEKFMSKAARIIYRKDELMQTMTLKEFKLFMCFGLSLSFALISMISLKLLKSKNLGLTLERQVMTL